jgi:hypothetical protein
MRTNQSHCCESGVHTAVFSAFLGSRRSFCGGDQRSCVSRNDAFHRRLHDQREHAEQLHLRRRFVSHRRRHEYAVVVDSGLQLVAERYIRDGDDRYERQRRPAAHHKRRHAVGLRRLQVRLAVFARARWGSANELMLQVIARVSRPHAHRSLALPSYLNSTGLRGYPPDIPCRLDAERVRSIAYQTRLT